MSINTLPDNVLKYAEKYTTAENETLAKLNRETNLRRGDAVMLSGHLQGAVLQMMSQMMQPRRILEIGTYTGYSAICLAQGLTDDGMLHTIEIDEELYDIADKYITQAGLRDKIVQHTGEAKVVIPTLQEQFDLVFIDADKSNYGHYFDLSIDIIPMGGYIVADNVLYDGEVLLPATQQSKNAKAIQQFNDKVLADSRVQRIFLPIRDGLMVLRKISE